jgi:hypothetical protein
MKDAMYLEYWVDGLGVQAKAVCWDAVGRGKDGPLNIAFRSGIPGITAWRSFSGLYR